MECPSEKVLNPSTGRCVKKTGRIGRQIMQTQRSTAPKRRLIIGDMECPSEKVLNPSTGRCVKKTGRIGRQIMQTQRSVPSTGRSVKKTGEIGRQIEKRAQVHFPPTRLRIMTSNVEGFDKASPIKILTRLAQEKPDVMSTPRDRRIGRSAV